MFVKTWKKKLSMGLKVSWEMEKSRHWGIGSNFNKNEYFQR